MSREFCRDVPDPWGCSKSLCKKSSCAFVVPYISVVLVMSVIFVKGDPNANHRFDKPQVEKCPIDKLT